MFNIGTSDLNSCFMLFTRLLNDEKFQQYTSFCFRTLWKKCCFSGDGEYIVAGSAKQHSLYIWEKAIGNLVKILPGPKGELLLDVVVWNICIINFVLEMLFQDYDAF